MEVNPPDPSRDADTEHKTDKRPGCANGYRLGGEKAVQQTTGGAECFHNGEVAAPVKHPSHQCGEHAKGGSQNDKRGRGEQRGSSLAEHPSLSLHDLAYGAHISRGQRLLELAHDRCDLLGRAIRSDLDGRRLDSCPGNKISEREKNAAVLSCAGPQRPRRREMDGASLKT